MSLVTTVRYVPFQPLPQLLLLQLLQLLLLLMMMMMMMASQCHTQVIRECTLHNVSIYTTNRLARAFLVTKRFYIHSSRHSLCFVVAK